MSQEAEVGWVGVAHNVNAIRLDCHSINTWGNPDDCVTVPALASTPALPPAPMSMKGE